MTSRLHLPGLLLALLLLVQSHIQAQNDYALEIETVSEDIGMLVGPLGITDLTGYSTTRLYIGNMNPNDFLSSVSGDATNATLVNTTTDFYQATLGAGTPNGINSLLFPVYPDLAYDSWVTIGLEGVPNAGGGEAGVSTVQSGNNPWLTNFDPGAGAAGGNIAIDDAIGGAWYALNGDANGVAGTDMRVLAGQFTTTGELSGQLYIQIFIEGDGADEFRDTFYFGAGAPVLGCTNAEACNYNVDATDDDGSCALPEAGLDCDGNCLADADLDGICDEDEVAGCDDNTACNFNAAATDNDGSCTYADAGLDCDGNCLADADLDGICDEDEVAGCDDNTACNFNAAATDNDGSCTYADAGLDCDGNCLADADLDGICDEDEVAGCDDNTACNFNAAATDNDGSCTYADAGLDCDGNCLADADLDGVCDEDEVAGCDDNTACNFNAAATDNDGSCTYADAGLDCDGNCLADADLDGICDEDEVAGCDDNTACNFNAAATDNDGSCTYADAGLDCDGNCLADADLDGVCDEDEVDGCTDPTASNFDPEATDDDGSCAYACGPDWGEPNTYPGVATVLALVTVEGENVGMMDAVGAYVGDELRGASAIIEFEGATYVNMTVYISGGEEDVTFVLFNQEECITCSMDGGVTAMSFGEYGSFESPLMFDANCSATSLTVDLSEGWNYVSTNLIPNDYAIATLLDDALNGTLLKALGDANFALGNSYTPGIPSVFNSLQSHSDAAGYVIKVNAAGTWTSQGLPLEANNTPLDLNEGWNIIGYVPQVAMSVEAALASINGSVGTVIDGQNGTVWNPANPNEFNSLLNLEPGRSYWLRMLEANTLTYPSAEDIDTNGLGVTPQEEESTAAGTTGWEVSRGPLASAVAAEIRLDDQAVSGEAYIGAFVADLCVAMRPLISTNNLTAVQLAVMLEESADVTFKLWRDGEVFTSSDILSLGGGEEMGQGGDIMPIVRFTSTTNGVWSPDVISALTISPVPASTEAWLDLNVNQDGQMHIGILDARGAEVAILHNGNLPAGQHRLSISVEGWAAGTYFVKGVSPIGVFRSPFIVQ